MSGIIMQFPNRKNKALTLSYDDGVEQDIKLIELAKKYGIKGTFNLNSGCYPSEDVVYEPGTIHRRMPKSKVTEVYKNCDWEVAAHGYTHPGLVGLSAVNITSEIYEDRKALEEQFGGFVRGFAYPYGAYSDTVVEVLKNCGIEYARTVNSTGNFFMPQDWLRLDPTAHHDDPKLMEMAEKFVNEKNPWSTRLFYLWGHSYEFEANDNWDVIENFMKLVSGKDDIWYATNIEIFDYAKAFEQLIFDACMTECFNPTARDLYFRCNNKEYVAKAGATISLN